MDCLYERVLKPSSVFQGQIEVILMNRIEGLILTVNRLKFPYLVTWMCLNNNYSMNSTMPYESTLRSLYNTS